MANLSTAWPWHLLNAAANACRRRYLWFFGTDEASSVRIQLQKDWEPVTCCLLNHFWSTKLLFRIVKDAYRTCNRTSCYVRTPVVHVINRRSRRTRRWQWVTDSDDATVGAPAGIRLRFKTHVGSYNNMYICRGFRFHCCITKVCINASFPSISSTIVIYVWFSH